MEVMAVPISCYPNSLITVVPGTSYALQVHTLPESKFDSSFPRSYNVENLAKAQSLESISQSTVSEGDSHFHGNDGPIEKK